MCYKKMIIAIYLVFIISPLGSEAQVLTTFFRPLSLMLNRNGANISHSYDTKPPILNFIGLVTRHGYPAEEHRVTTEDGYKLRIHRIPGSPKSLPAPGKPVVFLQHGVFSSSDIFVLHGPNQDLAFLLADNGYDVWIGNSRGNTYSRAHVRLFPDKDPEFWYFSFQEIAFYDASATIDFILRNTGEKSLVFIGHSVGATVGLALLSTKPEYNNKVRLFVALGPTAYWRRPKGVVRWLRTHGAGIKRAFIRAGRNEIFPQKAVGTFFDSMCGDESSFSSLCGLIVERVVTIDPKVMNKTELAHVFSHFPAGASTRTLFHCYQNLVSGKFQMYDYGEEENLKIYGQKLAPMFDLGHVTAPTVLIYGKADIIATPEDTKELARNLPNVVLVDSVPNEKFNHLDFLLSVNAKSLLYDRIIKIVQQFS